MMERFEPKQGNVFFQATIEVLTTDDKGREKKVREQHLVDAVNVTEAEKKIEKEMEGTVFEWKITALVRSKISVAY